MQDVGATPLRLGLSQKEILSVLLVLAWLAFLQTTIIDRFVYEITAHGSFDRATSIP